MSKLETTRSKLDKKLFNLNVLGSNVTITPITRTEGDFGGYEDKTETEGTPVDTVAVPYNRTTFNIAYESFGNLAQDEIMMVFRYTESIEQNYKVTFNSNTYRVKVKKDIPLNNGIVAIICKLKKEY